MLFTDTFPVTQAELYAVESALLTDAKAGTRSAVIDLTDVIFESTNQAADVLLASNQSVGGYRSWPTINGISGNHYAGLHGPLSTSNSISRFRLGQVVVDDLSPMRRSPIKTWMINLTLTNFYRRITNKVAEQDDRFTDRRNDYAQRTYAAFSLLSSIGVPIVRVPFPCPGALGEVGSGTWDAANITQAVTAGPTGGVFWVAVTWVDMSSSNYYRNSSVRNNGESGYSQRILVNVTAGRSIRVDITSLNPPNGILDSSQVLSNIFNATLHGTHWNVYVAPGLDTATVPDPSAFVLQNTLPIPVATKSYTLPADPLTVGPRMINGQTFERQMSIPGAALKRG